MSRSSSQSILLLQALCLPVPFSGLTAQQSALQCSASFAMVLLSQEASECVSALALWITDRMEANESTTRTFAAALQALCEADCTFVLPEAPNGDNSSQGQVVHRMLACQPPMAAELRQFAQQQRSEEEVPGLELPCRLGLPVSAGLSVLLSCPATQGVRCW